MPAFGEPRRRPLLILAPAAVWPQPRAVTVAAMSTNPLMHGVRAIVGLLLLAACASPAAQSESPASVAPSDSPANSASTRAPASVEPSAEPAAAVIVDTLARTTVENLTVRTEPSTSADQLGLLPEGKIAFVNAGPVEADGYTWYQLGSPGIVSEAECGGETPQFQCTSWVGWAAATTPTGDQWIVPSDAECPPERDTATYLSMDAVERLACAGGDEWRLIAYIAAPGGRGCMPAWNVDPSWMDPSCSFFFPQPVQRELDEDTSLQGFIAPELGECGPGGCPWDDLTGSWVEVVGHLDDPVAETCTYVLNSQVDEAPSPPPDPDLAVFRCRLNFVVTDLAATTPPTS